MRRLLILLLAGALSSACTTTPLDPWADLEADARPAVRPQELPRWPQPIEATESTVTFDLDGTRALDAYRAAGATNTRIAEANADQVDALNEAAGHLIAAGRGQRQIAELRAEMLEDERRHHLFTSIGYWVVIVALGVAAQ